MKTLYESLLDDFDELDKNVQQNAEKSVMDFLIDNYKVDGRPVNPDTKKIKISNKPNKDGKYEVDVDGNIDIKNRDIYTLTNDFFVFGKVKGYFYCTACDNLTSLKGAPEKVSGDFYCSKCNNLTSLEGAPKEVRRNFDCLNCKNLTSLKGAPEKVGGCFDCSGCNKLKNLDYLPKEIGSILYTPGHLKNN